MQATVVVHLQGDLGNQLFAYAAALSLARRENAKLLLNTKAYKADARPHFALASYRIEAEVCNKHFPFAKKYKEKHKFYFETLPANLQKNEVLQLEGEFQHWHFSEDVLPLLQEQLVLPKGLDDSQQHLRKKIQNSNAVAVHIQRTDDSAFSWEKTFCSPSYYTRAIAQMKANLEKPHFFVFCDDPTWIEKNCPEENLATASDWTFVQSKPDSPVQEFELLRNCKHFILSASSIDYWAARLGEQTNSTVIVPRLWFLLHGIKSTEFCPSHWQVLPDQARFQTPALEPKVSVIIPVYNVKEYLSDCIESVLDQSFQDIEILLVDDASTDDSLLIAEQYAKEDARIRILHHPDNRGLGAARNTGIEAAKGDYLQFVDSDDWIHPSMIELLYREFLGKKEKSIALCDYVQTSRFQFFQRIHFNAVINKNDIFQSHGLGDVSVNKLYSRDLFLPSGIRFPDACYYEDTAIIALLIHDLDCVKFTPLPLYYHNHRADSITKSSLKKKHILSYAEVIKHIVKGLRARGWQDYYPLIDFVLGNITKGIWLRSFTHRGLPLKEKLKCIQELYKEFLNIPEIASFPSKLVQLQLHCFTKMWFLVCICVAVTLRLLLRTVSRSLTKFCTGTAKRKL